MEDVTIPIGFGIHVHVTHHRDVSEGVDTRVLAFALSRSTADRELARRGRELGR
jgi:hypothetical protein